MTPMDEKQLKFIPEAEAVVPPPPDLIKHVKDCWWIVHPEKGLVVWLGPGRRHFSPQCNRNKEIAERMMPMYPWAEVKFFPSVFYKIDPNDYVG